MSDGSRIKPTSLNHCVSSNARKLILSCGSILKYANLGHELGQSNVELGHELGQLDCELGQSDINPNLGGEPLGMNAPPVECTSS